MRIFRKCYPVVVFAAIILLSTPGEGANPRGGNITVPVMTALTVKLDEAVNAKTVTSGTGFTASIKDPVQVDGVTVIPARASAGGLVNKESQNNGEIELNSVFVNGRMYRITTSPIPFNQKTNLRAGSTITFHLVLSLNLGR